MSTSSIMIDTDIIYNEDCIDTMARFPDNCICLVVTYPPYDNMRKYNGTSFNEFETISCELCRVIKDGRVVVWVMGDQTRNGNESGTLFTYALFFKDIGFNLFDTMIYLKPPHGAVGNNKTCWQSFEYLFVFSKNKLKTINLLIDRENKDSRDGDNGTKRLYNGTLKSVKRNEYEKMGKRTNVWEYYTKRGHSATDNIEDQHPSIFSKKLARDHNMSWSSKGDIVYDPFMGSGTTTKMCVLNDRKYIRSELDKNYYRISKKRLKTCQTRTQLDCIYLSNSIKKSRGQ